MLTQVEYELERSMGKLKVWDAELMDWREPQTLEEKIDALTEVVLELHRKISNLSK